MAWGVSGTGDGMTRLGPDSNPVRRRVMARKAPHGVEPEIIVTIYPSGEIGLREARRPARTEKRLAIGEMYALAVQSAVLRMGRTLKTLRNQGLSLAEARKRARRECGL